MYVRTIPKYYLYNASIESIIQVSTTLKQPVCKMFGFQLYNKVLMKSNSNIKVPLNIQFSCFIVISKSCTKFELL